jgi:hypothetical protein
LLNPKVSDILDELRFVIILVDSFNDAFFLDGVDIKSAGLIGILTIL